MIDNFIGKHYFLSNFYQAEVIYNGIRYSNNEAAFQAQKVESDADRYQFAKLSPSDAKKLGRRVTLRKDWEAIKDNVMYEICLAKFKQNEDLKKQLLETGNEPLEEGNDWGDMIWGTVNGVGENRLGKILMRIRAELAGDFNPIAVKNDCVKWIRDFFNKNGKGCNAIIGISGGKDSSVVAALCVEALGKDKVIGVLMPDGEQSDISDSYALVDHLGIRFVVVNIKNAIYSTLHSILTGVRKNDKMFEFSEQTTVNLPPRIRMATLYAISQSMNGRVANTCNLSEDWVGYSTRYGDSVGDFSPLSDLTVTEVRAIGHALGLPAELVDKVPTDGLCGATDEDRFGFTYEVLDKYIRTREIDDEDTQNRIDELHRKNLFKLQLMPKFEYKGW